MRSVLLILLLCAFPAVAQDDASVRVILDPPVIPFHKQATFTIEVECAGDIRPELPSMVDRFGGLSVYGMPKYELEPTRGGRLLVKETYTLDAIFAGEYAIEPVTVTLGPDREITVSSPILRVRELTDLEIEEAERFDPSLPDFAPAEAGAWWKRWPLWAGVGVLGAALIAVLLLMRRRGPEAVGSAPEKTPWEMALERLRVLAERNLPQAGKIGAYYVDLSAILRYYIEGRFQLHAPERTTPEFLEEAAERGMLDEHQEQFLAAFLRHCDRVKFARYNPSSDEVETGFAQVERFVNDTVPAPEPEEEGAAV